MPETGIPAGAGELLADFSLGMAWKEISDLERVRALIPVGTRVHVGFVDSGDLATRVGAARAARQSGFVPVPVIAARRLRSEAMLREYLGALQAAGASGSVLIVAGDPPRPRGPYPDTASVIGSGLLERYAARPSRATSASCPLIPPRAGQTRSACSPRCFRILPS